MSKTIDTVTVPFTEEDRALVEKLARLRKSMGIKSKAAIMRRALADWPELRFDK